jgi:hypothetical protein
MGQIPNHITSYSSIDNLFLLLIISKTNKAVTRKSSH